MPIPDNIKQITECALALTEKQDKMEQKKNYKTEQVKPQNVGQRVTFDQNGELVVLTNKGKLDAKGKQEVVLDGLFSINARDLAKLLSMVTDVKFKEESYFRSFDGCVVNYFNPEKDVQDLIHEINRKETQNEELRDTIKELERICLDYKLQISDFNKSRHFWERKFVLKPEEDNE